MKNTHGKTLIVVEDYWSFQTVFMTWSMKEFKKWKSQNNYNEVELTHVSRKQNCLTVERRLMNKNLESINPFTTTYTLIF